MKNKPFFMVFLENESTPTYKHDTIESAETEAKRLSKLHKKKAYVLFTLKSFELSEFTIQDFVLDEGLPF